VLSVSELLDHIQDEAKLLAGGDGLGRMITWAHPVDTAEPWLWVAPSDLVMTTGTNLPSNESGQVEWLHLLDSSRVAGILIEIPYDGLDLSDGLIEAAEARNLPLISAPRPILFHKIAHLVVESALRSQWERTEMVQRLFSSYTTHLRRWTARRERLELLSQTLGGAEVMIVHKPTNSVIFHHLPASVHPDPKNRIKTNLPGPGREVAYVTAGSPRLLDDDDFMWHWATLVTMELGFEKVQLDQARAQGQPILHDLLNGRLEASAIQPLLKQRGLTGHVQIVALSTGDSKSDQSDPFSRIHLIPGLREEPNLICDLNGMVYVALRHPISNQLLRRLVSDGETHAGLSRPVSASNRYPEAADQAANALKHARAESIDVVDFDEFVRQRMGVFDRVTAQQQINTVLRPLINYDEKNGTELLNTLSTYLRLDRAGTKTAEVLVIHRQTLVYRLKMIQRLTRIEPNSTEGIVIFHNALTALQRVAPRCE